MLLCHHCAPELLGFFNWTMTYREDSDFPVPYGTTVEARRRFKNGDTIFRRRDGLKKLNSYAFPKLRMCVTQPKDGSPTILRLNWREARSTDGRGRSATPPGGRNWPSGDEKNNETAKEKKIIMGCLIMCKARFTLRDQLRQGAICVEAETTHPGGRFWKVRRGFAVSQISKVRGKRIFAQFCTSTVNIRCRYKMMTMQCALVCFREGICDEELVQGYKFYLSFENNLCQDYVTEKFWNAMRRNVVPVI